MAEVRNKAQLTSAVDLFGKSYAVVKRNLNVYALVYAVPAALAVASFIQILNDDGADSSTEWSWSSLFTSAILGPDFGSDSSLGSASTALAFVLFVGTIVSYLLAVVLNLRAAQRDKVTFSEVWSDLTQNWLWVKLIGLSIVTGIIILMGLILLVVPGVILIWRLFLAPYALIDKKLGIFDSLSVSWNMTKGYAWPIYSILILGLLLALSGVIPVVGVLISFLLGVAYAAAPALRYQEIKKHS